MKKLLLVGLALALALVPMTLTSCGKENPVQPSFTTEQTMTPGDTTTGRIGKPGVGQMATTTWNSPPYILSEARYALSQSRSGTSTRTYNGYYMGDWNWPTGGSDNWAFEKVKKDYASAIGTVGMGTYEYGGWCKFFVSLALFRSSYGLGNNNHLYLPAGYTYADTDPKYAGPGWVLQSTMPHTAIIDSPHYNANGVQDGWWVIDSNWIGTTSYKDASGVWQSNYSYWVGKHWMSFSTLSTKGFKAWKPNLMKQYF